MSNTLTKIEITHLPENTSKARELQWQMEFWRTEYAQSALMADKAWKMYDEAIDEGLCKTELDDFRACAEMFDAMCAEAGQQFETAKADYLQLFN